MKGERDPKVFWDEKEEKWKMALILGGKEHHMNLIATGIEEGRFLHEIRRAETEAEFFEVCDRNLTSDELMPSEPPISSVFPGIAAA